LKKRHALECFSFILIKIENWKLKIFFITLFYFVTKFNDIFVLIVLEELLNLFSIQRGGYFLHMILSYIRKWEIYKSSCSIFGNFCFFLFIWFVVEKIIFLELKSMQKWRSSSLVPILILKFLKYNILLQFELWANYKEVLIS